MKTESGVNIESSLLPILKKYGLSIMATSALSSAKAKLGFQDEDVLTHEQFENLIEEIMVGYRTFCTPESRRELWIALVDVLE